MTPLRVSRSVSEPQRRVAVSTHVMFTDVQALQVLMCDARRASRPPYIVIPLIEIKYHRKVPGIRAAEVSREVEVGNVRGLKLSTQTNTYKS